MKKKMMIIFCVAAIGVFLFQTGRMVGANSSEPGSAGDPLITKSYLEQRLSQNKGGDAASAVFHSIGLKAGQLLTLGEGAEIVIYSGNGQISGSSGLLNLSSGELFSNGTSTVLYSLYLAAGRNCGLKAAGAMTVYVKGSYVVN